MGEGAELAGVIFHGRPFFCSLALTFLGLGSHCFNSNLYVMSIFNARRLSFINKAEKRPVNADEKGHLISWKFNQSSLQMVFGKPRVCSLEMVKVDDQDSVMSFQKS